MAGACLQVPYMQQCPRLQLSACSPEVDSAVAGFWPIKFCVWLFILGITFVFPNSSMSGYGQFARVMAGFWLLFQIIILLDFIYDVNEWLLKKVSVH